jgi:uncharacterized RDD family membrane protein YckC
MDTSEEKEAKLYCEKCGAEIDNDSVYCTKCGYRVERPGESYIKLATWTQRFIALVIDGIILGIILVILRLPGYTPVRGLNLRFGVDNIMEFLYFMFMDYYYGQSVGKKVMNLRVTKIGGAPLNLVDAAIESFGKIFLLPLDFLIGFFMYRNLNQRLFNYLSDTVVVREE